VGSKIASLTIGVSTTTIEPIVATTKPPSGAGWLYAFALVFCLFGATMLVLAGYQVRAGMTGLAAFAAVSGLIFAIVGSGLILTLRQGIRTETAAAGLRAQHPEAPWLWRSDWAAGHIFSEGGANALASWLLATFWNAIAWPIFYFIYFNPSQPFRAIAGFEVVSVIFPLSGVVLIILALRATLRWVSARGSYFEMSSIPGQIGGVLSGTIRLMPPSRANREFKLVLLCVHREAGQQGASADSVLYRDEQKVRGSGFSGIGVHFVIPPEAHQTDLTAANDTYTWRLDVTAPFSSRTFEAQFEVPVFNAGRLPERRRFADGATEGAAVDERSFVPPPNFPVRTRVLPTGATEIYFPPCRAPAAAVGATLFTAGWSAMFLMIVHIDAPVVFDAVWAAFDAFMIFGVASLWFGDTRVTLDGSSIDVARGVPGVALSHRTIPASEVHGVTAAVGSRTGTNTYYRLQLTYGGGRKLSFGDGLSDKRAAEWLAQEISGHLGVA
jgi:hypothetical protein